MAQRTIKVSHPLVANQEREANKFRNLRGSVYGLLSDPVPETPKTIAIPKKSARNFSIENKKQLGRTVSQRQLKLLYTDSIPKPLWTSSKYSNVASKVFEEPEMPSDVKIKRDFLRAHSKTDSGSRGASSRGASDRSMTSKLLPYSSRSSSSGSVMGHSRNNSLPQSQSRDATDFVRVNGRTAKIPQEQSPVVAAEKRHGFLENLDNLAKAEPGTVPKYLLRRQEEWKQAEKAAEKELERSKLPKGCQLMDDEQRAIIVEELRRMKQEKELELFRLPIRSDTLRSRIKREELEAALIKMDDQLEMLSKPKVYIPIDDCEVVSELEG